MRRVWLALIAALVVADIALVGAALHHVRGRTVSGASAVAPPPVQVAGSTPTVLPSARPTPGASPAAPTPGGSPSPTPSPSPAEASPSAGPGPGAPGLLTLVAAGPGGAVVEATHGTCGVGGAQVALSSDGGQTFTAAHVPVAVVVRVISQDRTHASVIGSGRSCGAYARYATTDGGKRWQKVGDDTDYWHLTAAASAAVHGPYSLVNPGCSGATPVISLAPLGGTAFALCAGGSVQASADNGATWAQQGVVPGAVAVAFADPARGLFAVADSATCAGIEIRRTTDGAVSSRDVGCVPVSAAPVVDLAVHGSHAYLTCGAQTWVSADDGASWSLAGTVG